MGLWLGFGLLPLRLTFGLIVRNRTRVVIKVNIAVRVRVRVRIRFSSMVRVYDSGFRVKLGVWPWPLSELR